MRRSQAAVGLSFPGIWDERAASPVATNVVELQEMRSMLAERVKTWTEERKRQGEDFTSARVKTWVA